MFTPDERKIFSYKHPDGTDAKADPLKLKRQLSIATRGRTNELFALTCESEFAADGKTPAPNHDMIVVQRMQSIGQLVDATAFAFDLTKFAPETDIFDGCTEQYLWDLFVSFMEWLAKKG